MDRRDRAIQVAIDELMNPQWAATEQILENHDLVMEDGKPVIARVREFDDAWHIFLPLAEQFYFLFIPVFFVDGDFRLSFCDIVPELNVYLIIFGTELTPDEITEEVGMQPTATVHMDQIPEKQRKNPWAYQHKWVYHPQRGFPAGLDEKLETLLNGLEPVQDRIAGLADRAEAVISIGYHGYCRSMGGMVLEPETLRRLSALGCTLDLDLYGNAPELPEPEWPDRGRSAQEK